MNQEKILTGKAPVLHISRCDGDLVIRSWAEAAVSLKGDGFEIDETEKGYTISSQHTLKLRVPMESTLRIGAVAGDLVVKNVQGDLSLEAAHGDAVLVGLKSAHIEIVHSDLSAKNLDESVTAVTIHGDAVLRSVGSVDLTKIHGDLSARYVNGDFHLAEGQGDMSLRTVNGNVTIEYGARDANLHNLGGIATVDNIQGDIRLRGGLSAGDHTFTAGRDIIVRWPYSEPINFTATAPQIVNRLTLEKETETENTLVGRLGDGETNATFTANGRIILKESEVVKDKWTTGDTDDMEFDFSFDFGNIGVEISEQINERVSEISEKFANKFGPEFTQRMASKIARKAEQAAVRAEQAAERARQRAERQAQRTSRYGRPPTPPKPSTPPKRKASTEEQIKILKMVEQGIITPDEAATLLEALEK